MPYQFNNDQLKQLLMKKYGIQTDEQGNIIDSPAVDTEGQYNEGMGNANIMEGASKIGAALSRTAPDLSLANQMREQAGKPMAAEVQKRKELLDLYKATSEDANKREETQLKRQELRGKGAEVGDKTERERLEKYTKFTNIGKDMGLVGSDLQKFVESSMAKGNPQVRKKGSLNPFAKPSYETVIIKGNAPEVGAQKIKIKAPDGREGYVSAEKLEEAKRNGAIVIN